MTACPPLHVRGEGQSRHRDSRGVRFLPAQWRDRTTWGAKVSARELQRVLRTPPKFLVAFLPNTRLRICQEICSTDDVRASVRRKVVSPSCPRARRQL